MMGTSIFCIREAETLIVAAAGPLTTTVYVECGLPGVVQIDHRRDGADMTAAADADHPRHFKRLWPLALRVIEAAVREHPERIEDVAGMLMPALGGPVGTIRWAASIEESHRSAP